MKKLILSSFILSAPLAQGQTYTGFYGNVGVGGTIMDVKVKEQLVVTEAGILTVTFPSNVHVEGRGFTPQIAAGYSQHFSSHLVLAAEFKAELVNAALTHKNAMMIFEDKIESKITTKLRNDFALVFKPGYVFHEHTQIYALIGPRWGNFETTLKSTTIDSSEQTNNSGYQVGITAGLGFSHLITERLSLGFEYAYTDYGRIQSLENSYNTEVDIGVPITVLVTDNADYDVTSNSFAFQLNYYF